ncbi:MAG TPA: ABC transporter ATP-binding protein [Actinomycetota bacterium]|nr:ABC transporter ATP-binding protein [Actinomycetota bacterium]
MSISEQIPEVPPKVDSQTVHRMTRVYGAILGLAWDIARRRAAALLASMILMGMAGAASGWLTKLLVDALAAGDADEAWKWGFVFLGQFAATVLLGHLLQFLQMDMGDRISQEVDRRLMAISTSAPGLDHLERPEFADKIKLVRNHHYVPFSALTNLNSVAYLIFGLSSALFLLATIHPLLIVMPLVAAPSAVIQFRSYRKHFRRWDDIAPEDRLSQHYLELATEPKAAKEVRLFTLGSHLIDRYRQITGTYIRTLFRDRLKRSGVGVVTGAAYGLTLGGAIGFIGWLALNRRATIGDVALGVQVSRMVIGHVEMAANLIAWLAELSFVGERYLWLLDYEPDVQLRGPEHTQPVPRSITSGIVLDGVSFTYPDTEKEVLHAVSLFIPAGATVALVGENGAGKSSLVKLLSRFYDPTGGSIRIDGIDLRDLDLDEWRSRVGAAFQDFVRFQLVAREAVGVGDLESIDDLDRVTTSARQSGADRTIDRLPSGYDTQLGRDFKDGTDLSEGEWQRVALARGSMLQNPVLLMLDEPTASLDARSEHEVFERFAELAQSAPGGVRPVTVLVSHRFSTVRMADLIVVLHEGRLEELGTHEELMQRGRRYAELFRLQASRYD